MRKINKYGYLLVFIIPLFLNVFLFTSNINYLYILPVLIFILLPIVDPIIGVDNSNFDADNEKKHKDDIFYKYLIYTWAIVQSITMLFILWYFVNHEITALVFVLLLLNTMIMNGGVGITVAHELGHKNDKLDKFFAKLLLLQVFYGHFTVEHNRGHHVNIGTPEDPATGLYNQSFYSFWYQSVVKGFQHAILLEKQYLKQKKVKYTVLNNEVYSSLIYSTFLLFVTSAIVYFTNADNAVYFLLFFLIQSFLSFSLLEAVNYIEHYGILRKMEDGNRYEKINPTHSWNANFIISNYLLFQLQRHSDHHLYSTKQYQVLKQYDESPQLPNGYPAMVILSLIPPLWKIIMNSRLNIWIRANESKRN